MLAVLRHPRVEQRNEGGGERALGEQAAEYIGELEGELPGIGDAAGAENAAEQHVAREAENAADHRQPADRPHAFDEAAQALSLPRLRVSGLADRDVAGRFVLRRLDLLREQAVEIDRFEQQRREAAIMQ